MQREITLITPSCQRIDHFAATVMEHRIGSHDGIVVRGCGMDMGFHLVYNLSSILFADSFTCIGPGCPSNDHSNGDKDYTPHLHTDAGYALRSAWI
jgi:hypothetical protein